MKPLDKLERDILEAIAKASFEYWGEAKGEREHDLMARAAAQVAKDLAERAMLHGMGHSYKKSKLKSFLTSEGITE